MRRIAPAAALAAVPPACFPSGAVQAHAYEGAHHVCYVSNRLKIDRRPMRQMRMDRGNGADLCVLAPGYNFRLDAETRLRNNLRAGAGGPFGFR